MRRKGILFIGMLLLLILTSCERKMAPSLIPGIQGKEFDSAAFNYQYVEAIKQKLMGNRSDAIKYLEQCINIDPENDASYYQIAKILIESGDLNNGKKFALKALSIDQKNIWYIMMLAGTYYQQHNLDSAIIYYEEAVKYYPGKENLQLTLGSLYSEQGNYDKANSIFNFFDSKYGVNESSTVASIKNLVAVRRLDEALVKAGQLLKQYPDEIKYNGLLAEIYREKGMSKEAMEVYNKLMERQSDSPETQLSLCNFLIQEKKYDELLLLLNTVILNEKIVREDKIALLVQMLEIPDLVEENGKKLSLVLMILEANYKDDNIVPLLRIDLLIKQNSLDEAAFRLEELILQRPDNYYAWEKLLLVYLQEEDYNMLMIRGEECATRFNRSFLAKILYANGAIENKKYSIALEELRKAEILAGNTKELVDQVVTMRADVYYRMKDYDRAFQIFEEAVKSNSNDLTVLNNYAYYLAEQNTRLKDAEQMARKVIEVEKENTTFLDTYAWVLYKRGKLKEAGRIMEKIINSGGKPDAEWYEHYGFILKKKKRCSEAIENWKKALSIDSTKTSLIKEIENCIK